MNGMIQTVNNLDFVPPVRTPSDIRTVCWEDWEQLLQEITLHSSYEVLILDMGSGIDENFHFTVPIFLSVLLYAGGVY